MHTQISVDTHLIVVMVECPFECSFEEKHCLIQLPPLQSIHVCLGLHVYVVYVAWICAYMTTYACVKCMHADVARLCSSVNEGHSDHAMHKAVTVSSVKEYVRVCPVCVI